MATRETGLIVVDVRAQALEDQLRRFLYRRDPEALYDAHWQAQRLESACEKLLGRRGRPYDR